VEITAWRDQEAVLVDPFSKKSDYSSRKRRTIVRQGLIRPLPYRLVGMALAALFTYGGVIKLLGQGLCCDDFRL
jgi:hypothetical protein